MKGCILLSLLQTCGHGWTSMKGRVVFWYFLHLPFCEGYVQFKLYGQQCMRCNNGIFEPAMWYPEEVNKVLCNLYNRIGQVILASSKLLLKLIELWTKEIWLCFLYKNSCQGWQFILAHKLNKEQVVCAELLHYECYCRYKKIKMNI